jgi:CelD/BcsL family acetyltransferase involved in cellulose biosynthesis
MQTELVRYGELDLDQVRKWRAWQQAVPGYASPFMHPRFTDAVSAVRQDARVLVVEDAGEIIAFWPLHVRPGGLARPIAAPLSDHTGPICRPDRQAHAGFDPARALRGVGLRALSFTGLTDPYGLFGDAISSSQPSHIAEFDDRGGEGFLADQNALYGKRFKNLRRKERLLERDFGAGRFILDDRRPESLARLFALKSEQFKSTGRHDVFSPNWVQKLIARLNDIQDPTFRAIVSTLEVEGELASSEFNLIAGNTLSSWIVAYDPKFSIGSPGHLIVMNIVREIGSLGVNRIDFGPGHDYYKKYFVNTQTPICDGIVKAPGRVASVPTLVRGLVGATERAPLGPIARVTGQIRRRFEQIVAVEPTFTGRVQGMVEALSTYRARAGSNSALADAAD